MPKFKWKHGAPKVAFVTGAASGLGQRFAQQLLSEGVRVAGFDLAFDQTARETLEAYAQTGQVEFFTADIADDAAVQDCFGTAITAMGPPDLLIHAAGISESAPFLETSSAHFARSIDVNLHGTRNVVAATLPAMKRGAHIVLTASLAGISGNYAYTSYCASKFGVVGLTEVLRMEMIEHGIDISSLCPAEIVTPMVLKEWENEDPIRMRLKAFAGSKEVGPACQLIMQDIARRKPRIFPGWRAKITVFLTHRTPALARHIARGMIQSELKKMGREGA